MNAKSEIVTRPTWCSKCGLVIPKNTIYVSTTDGIFCQSCWKRINTGLQPYSVKENK